MYLERYHLDPRVTIISLIEAQYDRTVVDGRVRTVAWETAPRSVPIPVSSDCRKVADANRLVLTRYQTALNAEPV
jgi:hypothetical protein